MAPIGVKFDEESIARLAEAQNRSKKLVLKKQKFSIIKKNHFLNFKRPKSFQESIHSTKAPLMRFFDGKNRS